MQPILVAQQAEHDLPRWRRLQASWLVLTEWMMVASTRDFDLHGAKVRGKMFHIVAMVRRERADV